MRLATWNVLHGRSLTSPAVDGERLARAVAALDADVLALQEVDSGQPRSGGLDLTAIAAEAMGGAASLFVPTLIGDPARAWRAADDADLNTAVDGYGIALLSRYPVLRWHVLRLPPSARFGAPPGDRLQRGVPLAREEPRAVVAATIRTPLGVWTVACAHLSFVPGITVRQLRRTMRWLGRLPGPRLLMGDLNMPPALARRVTGARSLARGATFPSHRPLVQLDHVLSADPLPPARQIRLPRPALSDHLPVALEL
ncbi:endonuclease/exonuclease/phosphatase family protein [Agrococcus sp. KRD186]|jgi:endonuclease/exonuclease/phosphatase family metal-dependent hydrolase|uniref:endonuclease/exonuclease/phosphatase family protein n=1 Tax=Agrococcus sp. KRD186 TaxID=2729730 RepID=UPI0019CF69CA|nr:endonuclease/exonuclease/phosphatase family protein [Agrococcus sp. KRD186]